MEYGLCIGTRKENVKMNKRLIAALLAVCLLLSLAPAALAEDEQDPPDGVIIGDLSNSYVIIKPPVPNFDEIKLNGIPYKPTFCNGSPSKGVVLFFDELNLANAARPIAMKLKIEEDDLIIENHRLKINDEKKITAKDLDALYLVCEKIFMPDGSESDAAMKQLRSELSYQYNLIRREKPFDQKKLDEFLASPDAALYALSYTLEPLCSWNNNRTWDPDECKAAIERFLLVVANARAQYRNSDVALILSKLEKMVQAGFGYSLDDLIEHLSLGEFGGEITGENKQINQEAKKLGDEVEPKDGDIIQLAFDKIVVETRIAKVYAEPKIPGVTVPCGDCGNLPCCCDKTPKDPVPDPS